MKGVGFALRFKVLKLKTNAGEYGQKITWPKTGDKYVALAEKTVKEEFQINTGKETEPDLLILPPFSLTHINRLTDDTGIIQHAKFGIPNLKEGYCLDDNARALLMVLMAYKQLKFSENSLFLVTGAAGFIGSNLCEIRKCLSL